MEPLGHDGEMGSRIQYAFWKRNPDSHQTLYDIPGKIDNRLQSKPRDRLATAVGADESKRVMLIGLFETESDASHIVILFVIPLIETRHVLNDDPSLSIGVDLRFESIYQIEFLAIGVEY